MQDRIVQPGDVLKQPGSKGGRRRNPCKHRIGRVNVGAAERMENLARKVLHETVPRGVTRVELGGERQLPAAGVRTIEAIGGRVGAMSTGGAIVGEGGRALIDPISQSQPAVRQESDEMRAQRPGVMRKKQKSELPIFP
jgi:hypothetical protein